MKELPNEIVGFISLNTVKIVENLIKTTVHGFLFDCFEKSEIKVKKILQEEEGVTVIFAYSERITRNEAARIITDFHKKCGVFESQLTEKEIGVVDKITVGKSYFKIGLEMGEITPSAIAGFVKRIREKFSKQFPTVKPRVIVEK